MSAIRWASAARSETGKVRKLNEDAVLAAPASGVWAVADGMGGHHAGDAASREVVAALSDLGPATTLTELLDAATLALQRANAAIFENSQRPGAQVSGSTVVCLLGVGDRTAVVWAGDSRCYVYRAGQLHSLTRDHSRVEELIERGDLSRQDAQRHPDANVITRAVGVTPTLEVDTRLIDALPGDVFLLCSDGLSRYVDETAMVAMLAAPEVETACSDLMDAALASPARDNISLVIAVPEFLDAHGDTVLNPQRAARGDGDELDPTVLE